MRNTGYMYAKPRLNFDILVGRILSNYKLKTSLPVTHNLEYQLDVFDFKYIFNESISNKSAYE